MHRMFSFGKRKASRKTSVSTITERKKPFTVSNRVRINNEAEPLYPGLLETRWLEQHDAHEQILIEQAIQEMLNEPQTAIPNVAQRREAPQSRYARPLDHSHARYRDHDRIQHGSPAADTRRPKPPLPSSEQLCHEIEMFLEQPNPDPQPPSIPHIAAQKRRKQPRPVVARRKSSQGKVPQTKRGPTGYRPTRASGKPIVTKTAMGTLPVLVQELRKGSMLSQGSMESGIENMNPAASGYCEKEGNVEQWTDVDDAAPLEWGEVTIALDPGMRTLR